MDKRELLLETATRLFVERGFHATPTSAITKEAGMSAGILFHYFKTKDDLIVELYVSLKKEYSGFITSGIDKVNSDYNKLRLVWSNSWNWGLDNPLKFKFLQQADNSTYAETIHQHPDLLAKYEKYHDFLEGFVKKGLVRDINREFLMKSMFSLIISMIYYISLNPELRTDNAFVEQAWEMFYNTLKP